MNTQPDTDHRILELSLEKLGEITRLEDIRIEQAPVPDRAKVRINRHTFTTAVMHTVTRSNYLRTLQTLRQIKEHARGPVLVVADYISPTTAQELMREGFSVLDSAGNCRIASGGLYLFIQGQKKIIEKETYTKAFNDTGLKLLFYFLINKENIAKPYRLINREIGLSLGSIKNIIEELTAKHYVGVQNGKRFILNRDNLVREWCEAYHKILKPKLYIGRMRLRDPNLLKKLASVRLPESTCWSGESAAYLIDGFLYPEELTLYSPHSLRELLETGKLIPDTSGSVLVYKKFWPDTPKENTAPRLLVYADLMGSGNSRCLEAAQKILEYGI